MEIRIGPPVSGENYFARPDIEELLRRKLGRGNVSFMAARRTGKTSLLRRLVDEAPDTTPHFLINLEKCTTPEHWLAEMVAPVLGERGRWGRALDRCREPLRKIEGLEFPGIGKVRFRGTDWRDASATFLDTLIAHAQPVVFLLDEFPILVDEMARQDVDRCRAMLRWFREWQQRTFDAGIRFLVTGSIGLDGVVKRYGLWDAVNQLERAELPPLEPEQGIAFLLRLSSDNGVALDEPRARVILDLVGAPWPYFLQIFVAQLRDHAPDPDRADLERIYQERMIGAGRDQHVDHMWERLRRVFEPSEERLAKDVLKVVARADEGLTRRALEATARRAVEDRGTDFDEELWRFVFQVLEHDGYLAAVPVAVPGGGDGPVRFRFFSNLLRDCWRRHYA